MISSPDLQSSSETQKRLSGVEIELKQNKDRCSQLQDRCIELAKKYEAERKQRLSMQREQKKKDRSGDGLGGGGGGGSDNLPSSSSSGKGGGRADLEMLDLTLGMLRCSVCRERFKEVCINRCFHLFCRECIDNSLKSRQRKCPA